MTNPQNYQSLVDAALRIARHYRIEFSEERLLLQLNWSDYQTTEQILNLLSRQIGLSVKSVKVDESAIHSLRLPLLIELKDGQIGVIDKISQDGQAEVQLSGDQGLAQPFDLATLQQHIVAMYALRPEKSIQDVRVDEYVKPYEENWFWSIALKDWKRYIDIMFASLIANILTLATILFSMNVYDRVIPAQSIPTLWVLFIGVVLAATFEFVLRVARIYLSDMIGKRADLRISDRVYGHVLRIKNSERPKSTGTFISQIRELEGVRDLVTSSTMTAVADLPFFFLFLVIFWLIGGPLVWIIVLIVPLMILPAILAQKKLNQLAQEGLRESSIRNAMLVESVQGIEDVKLLRAESRFQNQWNHMNDVAATISMKQRKIVGILGAWSQKIQGLTFAIVVLVGCFAVIDGDMTTGALVACSILSSRMLGPISQIVGILNRWQQAKIAKTALDELMKKPIDQPERAHLIHRSALYGQYELQNIQFAYHTQDKKAVLTLDHLHIKAGEKVAILGRNGAGKSTLLQLLAGMQTPLHGKVKLDDLNLNLIDPADLRRDMSFLSQHSRLFFGTLRENLTLGAPLTTDDEIIHALKLSGALSFVLDKETGLDYPILEGGLGLSSGQKQALLLARLILRQPNIVLLDEPTANIDDVSEKELIQNLKPWLANRTLIVATHRRAVLEWVDRIIIVNNGRIVSDDTRENILNSKTKNSNQDTQHA